MYSNGFNLRHMVVQGIPVLTTEILIRLYNSIKYWENTEFSKEMIKHKQNKMLLISHTCATAVNIGKVIITKNPTLLNLPMILRVIKLALDVISEEINITQKAIVKVNMGVLKNKLELKKTLILLDKTVYYTSEINRLIINSEDEYNQIKQENQVTGKRLLKEYNTKLQKYKEI
jgi:hypothetical protein